MSANTNALQRVTMPQRILLIQSDAACAKNIGFVGQQNW
jgi:hypothetical protein